MKLLLFLLLGSYAQDGLKRLELELKYLENRETFLYLPKKEMILENSDEVKTVLSGVLKGTDEEIVQSLLEDMEENSTFKEDPINAQ